MRKCLVMALSAMICKGNRDQKKMAFEMSVTVKNDDKRMTTKHLMYEPCAVSFDDPIIKGAVEDAVDQFGGGEGEVLDIRVKITLEVQ